MKVWTYVIAVDAGAAPNFQRPATTLTVCKPRIRKHAEKGNLVLAFNGKKLSPQEPHSVCWAGIVSEKILLRDYWRDRRFKLKRPGGQQRESERPDNIYKPMGSGRLVQVRNVTHKLRDMRRDLSGLYSLVLKPSWYFGQSGTVLPANFNLRMLNSRRGERSISLPRSQWVSLLNWLSANEPEIEYLQKRSGPAICSLKPRRRCYAER